MNLTQNWNCLTVKSFGSNELKLVCFKHNRNAQNLPKEETKHKPGEEHEEKLSQSISRARSRILELALSNPWDYFVTATLDPAKYDRYDLDGYKKDFAQFIRDQRKRGANGLVYLLIPEPHEDGAWHMHGLIKGLPREHTTAFSPGLHPQYLIEHEYRNWPAYGRRFGFVSLGVVKDANAVSRYITKYVSKQLAKRSDELGAHLYYASQGLQGAELIHTGTFQGDPGLVPWDYENEYVSICWGSSENYAAIAAHFIADNDE